LNDYFTIRKVEKTPRIEIPLSKHIKQLEEELAFEEEFAAEAGYNEDELKSHQARQANRKRTILRYKLKLKKSPRLTIIVDGPIQWEEVAELDLVKLVADKERGKIKSLAHTAHGVKVELFAADSAIVNVARIHGLFEKDNEQSKPEITALDKLDNADLNSLVAILKKQRGG
jgi:hypothetical protein